MVLENQGNTIANGEIPVEQPPQQPQGLSMEQLDHEFMGRGDPQVEALRLQEQYQQNLTPEELARLKELAPAVEEFFLLDYKGKTGEFPEGERELGEDAVAPEEQMTVEEYGNVHNVDNKEEVLSDLFGSRKQLVPEGAEIPRKQVAAPQVQPREEAVAQSPAPVAPAVESAPEPRIRARTGMEVPSLEEAGESGMIAVPGKSNTGVADDIPMDVQEGDFILNAAAVKHSGIADVNRMIEDATEKYKQLVAQGTIKPVQGKPIEEVPIRISNGEVRVSKQLAEVIGMDKLEKMNNRGLAKTEEELQEKEQIAQSTPSPEKVQSPKGRMT